MHTYYDGPGDIWRQKEHDAEKSENEVSQGDEEGEYTAELQPAADISIAPHTAAYEDDQAEDLYS